VRTDDFAAFAAAAAGPDDLPLLPDALRAMHCWNFCRGGRLELLPLYHAVHGIEDWELTTELLAVIEDKLPARIR
jgi:hypothetical protein